MPTCPDCGSIIMEGDPYCPHCGAHLDWSDDEEYGESSQFNVDDIFYGMYISGYQRSLLEGKINSFLKSKDCTRLLVRESYGSYIFEFTRENEYVRTIDEFIFDPKYENPSRVFWECQPHHYHDKLIANPDFKRLISKMGLEFLHCRGGYVSEYVTLSDEFRMVDEIRISVTFRVGDNTVRIYDLDLDRFELSKEYHEFKYY